MRNIPAKLKNDAIAEALCEIRFECDESNQIPELVLGRLADRPAWRTYQNVRLPLADFPSAVRLQTPDMKFQAVMELRGLDTARVVKIGPNVLSYHALAPYPGWEESLEKEIHGVIDHLFGKLSGARTVRLGLRYVNLLTLTEHRISKLSDLNYTFSVSGKVLDAPQMLSFERKRGPHHTAMVRIASPNFVLGPQLKPFSALIDVDVYASDNFAESEPASIKTWFRSAHDFEKEEFFGLLTERQIDELKEL